MAPINTVLLLYLIWRLHCLESRRPAQPVKTVVAPGLPLQVPDWQKPVENFNPAKPETLRPRTDEETAKRIKTDWEILSHITIKE